LTREPVCDSCREKRINNKKKAQEKMSRIIQPNQTVIDFIHHPSINATPVQYNEQGPGRLIFHTHGGFSRREIVALHLIAAEKTARPDKWDGGEKSAAVVYECWEDARNILAVFDSKYGQSLADYRAEAEADAERKAAIAAHVAGDAVAGDADSTEVVLGHNGEISAALSKEAKKTDSPIILGGESGN